VRLVIDRTKTPDGRRELAFEKHFYGMGKRPPALVEVSAQIVGNADAGWRLDLKHADGQEETLLPGEGDLRKYQIKSISHDEVGLLSQSAFVHDLKMWEPPVTPSVDCPEDADLETFMATVQANEGKLPPNLAEARLGAKQNHQGPVFRHDPDSVRMSPPIDGAFGQDGGQR
jgi:hypothetical protein